ncbi:hypothetical protein HAX54_021860 [Datura stramonium]|uniref:Uncharacterized protein n=1 Tax=Datura stramonium TaxID=4076 RepID=A0ABS8Y5D2_DATST|nr:hypothetical protein [Datura stramonium]
MEIRVATQGTWFDTAPTSLSPERESDGSLGPTSPATDNLTTLIADIRSRGTHPAGGLGGASDIASSSQSKDALDVKILLLEKDRLRMKIEKLKGQVAHNEETEAACHTDLLTLIQILSPCVMSSPSIPGTISSPLPNREP